MINSRHLLTKIFLKENWQDKVAGRNKFAGDVFPGMLGNVYRVHAKSKVGILEMKCRPRLEDGEHIIKAGFS